MSGDLEPRAELAELTLVRTDWRTQRDTDAVKRPSGFERIDNRRSALDMTRVAVVEAEDFVANLDNGGLLTSAAIDLLPLIARIYSSKEPNAVIAATFLLIHDINKLHAFLNTCSQTEIIGQMKEGLTDAFAPPHEDPRALVARIIALRKEGRLDEAVKLSVEADVLYPSEALFRIQLAGIAQDQGDWCRALSHWAIVREEFPYINSGFIGGANCLVQAGQSGKAVAVIADGLEKLPDDPAIWNTALGIAEHMDDGDEVRQRLAEIRGRSSSEVLR
jgi:predicted Zn-dependent protease